MEQEWHTIHLHIVVINIYAREVRNTQALEIQSSRKLKKNKHFP